MTKLISSRNSNTVVSQINPISFPSRMNRLQACMRIFLF